MTLGTLCLGANRSAADRADFAAASVMTGLVAGACAKANGLQSNEKTAIGHIFLGVMLRSTRVKFEGFHCPKSLIGIGANIQQISVKIIDRSAWLGSP